MTLPTSLKNRVLEEAHRRPSPVRGRPQLPAGARVALAALAMVAALFAWGGPEHAAGRPDSVSAWVVLGVVALATAVTWTALPARGSMLPPPDARLLAVALGVPFLVGAWLIAWHSAYDDPFSRTGIRCFALTVAAAPGPFVALLAAGPRFAPSWPRLAGAAVGAASGAWAAVVVELWCPLAAPSHVLSGHVLPLFALSAAGALLGPRVLGLRRV